MKFFYMTFPLKSFINKNGAKNIPPKNNVTNVTSVDRKTYIKDLKIRLLNFNEIRDMINDCRIVVNI